MTSASHTRPRILIVDDEPAMVDLLADLLEDEGYSVECAYNGAEALTALQAGNVPDLVLSDVMMPKLSGVELVAEARRMPRLQDLPFMLLSAGGEPPRIRDDVLFMPKPLKFPHLLEQVAAILGRRHTGAAQFQPA